LFQCYPEQNQDIQASKTQVKRFYEEFQYQAASWDKERRVIAKIEWHAGELFPRVGFIVTNLPPQRCAPQWPEMLDLRA